MQDEETGKDGKSDAENSKVRDVRGQLSVSVQRSQASGADRLLLLVWACLKGGDRTP